LLRLIAVWPKLIDWPPNEPPKLIVVGLRLTVA
jgi:hypothetical protein